MMISFFLQYQNLRVARNLTDLAPPPTKKKKKKLDLRVARKSTTSPLPV